MQDKYSLKKKAIGEWTEQSHKNMKIIPMYVLEIII